MSINTPETCGDETINQLWEGADMTDKLDKLFGHEMKQAEAVQAALNRIDRVMHQAPEIDLRGTDLRFEFKGTFRGKATWWCWDAVNGQEVYGEGDSQEMALVDFNEKREEPKRRSRVIHHSNATDPADYSDKRDESGDFDDDLEDRP